MGLDEGLKMGRKRSRFKDLFLSICGGNPFFCLLIYLTENSRGDLGPFQWGFLYSSFWGGDGT